MSYLIDIDEKNNVILRPACYKLSPELSAISEKELLFIILAYDYFSIYRQYPEHDRIRKAMFHVFNDNIPKILEKPSVKLATEAYKGMQYSPKIELCRRYERKIDKMLDLLDDDDSPTSIEKTTKAIDSLRKNILSLEQEVSEAVLNKGAIKGGMELSFLEEIMQNKKYYESVIAKK